jgi:hypothetical protein
VVGAHVERRLIWARAGTLVPLIVVTAFAGLAGLARF